MRSSSWPARPISSSRACLKANARRDMPVGSTRWLKLCCAPAEKLLKEQFVADMNQLKVRAAQTPELSTLGAVFSGCLGLKIYQSLEDLQNLSSGYTEYGPTMPAARAQDLFVGWQAAVQQVLYQPQQG
jgi:glycerol kinase